MNPNVLYELGVAHSFNKNVIIITRDELEKLPFDLKQYRAKDYSTHFVKFEALVEHLRKCMRGAIDGTMQFSNPIKDFLTTREAQSSQVFSDENSNHAVASEEKGYFDIITEIETSTSEFIEAVNDITAELDTMNSNVQKSTDSINTAKSNGTASASFAQVQAKIVAGHIDRFSRVLRDGNKRMNEKWDAIERGVSELLESEIVEKTDQLENLRKYLSTLLGTKVALQKANTSVVDMKKSLGSLIGFERTLNQATHFLEHDLDEFIEVTAQMISSIDRISKKSKYIVGEISFNNPEAD